MSKKKTSLHVYQQEIVGAERFELAAKFRDILTSPDQNLQKEIADALSLPGVLRDLLIDHVYTDEQYNSIVVDLVIIGNLQPAWARKACAKLTRRIKMEYLGLKK